MARKLHAHRRVSSGPVEHRRKGIVKGWETVEICTGDPAEVRGIIRGLPPEARIWISVKGTPTYRKDIAADIDSPEIWKLMQKHLTGHVTVLSNRPRYELDRTDVQDEYVTNLEPFWDEENQVYDIEYYCLRTKPGLV